MTTRAGRCRGTRVGCVSKAAGGRAGSTAGAMVGTCRPPDGTPKSHFEDRSAASEGATARSVSGGGKLSLLEGGRRPRRLRTPKPLHSGGKALAGFFFLLGLARHETNFGHRKPFPRDKVFVELAAARPTAATRETLDGDRSDYPRGRHVRGLRLQDFQANIGRKTGPQPGGWGTHSALSFFCALLGGGFERRHGGRSTVRPQPAQNAFSRLAAAQPSSSIGQGRATQRTRRTGGLAGGTSCWLWGRRRGKPFGNFGETLRVKGAAAFEFEGPWPRAFFRRALSVQGRCSRKSAQAQGSSRSGLRDQLIEEGWPLARGGLLFLRTTVTCLQPRSRAWGPSPSGVGFVSSKIYRTPAEREYGHVSTVQASRSSPYSTARGLGARPLRGAQTHKFRRRCGTHGTCVCFDVEETGRSFL